MKTLAEKIAVMQAAERGEKIEATSTDLGRMPKWVHIIDPQWDWMNNDYRVAPKKPREFIAFVNDGRLYAVQRQAGERETWLDETTDISQAFKQITLREVIEDEVPVDRGHDDRVDAYVDHWRRAAQGIWDQRITLLRDTPIGTTQVSTDGGKTWRDRK